MGKRVLIVGGVAGGASAAARLRRLDEGAEIVIFERGPDVSFANCGLPYFVGGVIEEERSLHVASRELFRDRFAIDVRVRHEALSIDRARRTLRVRDLRDGAERDEPYDALVLSPGAAPLRPAGIGAELPGVFTVRTIGDAVQMRGFLASGARRDAVVVGGGFIGLEMAENLAHRGLRVAILEQSDQLLAPLDPELARFLEEQLAAAGVELRLGEGLREIAAFEGRLAVQTDRGRALPADLVVLALGVKPEVRLAAEAGLELGGRGGIRVDAGMRTSDANIYAVGDAVEVRGAVLDQPALVPLAGPAHRQGRVAAERIAGKPSEFRGVQATAIVHAFGLTAATTGASEKALRRAGRSDFAAVYLHPGHHAGYYPGAQPLHLKLVFEVPGGRILGAQAVGREGVDKRIDVIAAMLQLGGSVRDLAEAELCYAPQFGSAKDPVNLAGMLAVNVLEGEMPLADGARLAESSALLLDVREPAEVARAAFPGALNIPLHQLRARLGELPRDREIWVACAAGQRGYFAQRILMQRGFQVKNLSGGAQTWLRPAKSPAAEQP